MSILISSSTQKTRTLAVSIAAMTIFTAVGRAQTISFDNECGTNKWYSACGYFDPPSGNCYCWNNWDTGTVTSTNCHACPRLPGAGDDVFIGNIFVEADYTSPIHSLTTTTNLLNTYIIDVSGTAFYGGPVTGNGAFAGNGDHYFSQLLTAGAGMEFRGPGSNTLGAGFEIPSGNSVFIETRVYNLVYTAWRGNDTIYIDGAYIPSGDGTFHNNPGALFLAEGDGEMRGAISLGYYVNAGTFRKDGGTGTTFIGSKFTNAPTGLLDVRTGHLYLFEGGPLEGSALVAAGARLSIGAGNNSARNIPTSFSMTGQGTLRLHGPIRIDPGASVSATNIDMGYDADSFVGYVEGTGSMTVSNTARLGGVFRGGSRSLLLPSTSSTLGAPVAIDEVGTQLNNAGVLNWNQFGIAIGTGASLNNLPAGLIECRANDSISDYYSTTGVLTNAGTIRQVSTIQTVINCPFINSGLLDVATGTLRMTYFHQTSGQTVLSGGEIETNSTTLEYEGGALRGNGRIRGFVNNSGAVVAPGMSAGVITIGGSIYGNGFTQGPGGTLEIEIGGDEPGTQYDQLLMTPPAQAFLDGTLHASFIDGFSPPSGVYDVLIAGAVYGQFAQVDLPDGMTVTYLPDRVRLEFTGSFCAADFNQDGGIDGGDVSAFFAAWEGGDSSADVNYDGGVDGGDVGAFFAVWEAGGC